MNEDGSLVPPGELRGRLDGPDAPTVIDVRDADEYAAGHLPGARHIPGEELRGRLDEVPRGRPVVTY
jgi:rhodanese-related sulfurtransferase